VGLASPAFSFLLDDDVILTLSAATVEGSMHFPVFHRSFPA